MDDRKYKEKGMESDICPRCGDKLKTESTVKLRGRSRVEIIGYHQFCINRECHFERNLKKKSVKKNDIHNKDT